MIEKECEICGEKISTNGIYIKYCPVCKEKVRKSKARDRYYKRVLKSFVKPDEHIETCNNPTKPKSNKSTQEQCAEIEIKCRELNITYGEYIKRYERGNYYG